MISVLLEVYVTVNNIKDAHEIAHDISEILGDCGITNSINIKEK